MNMFTTESVIAWARSKTPDDTFHFVSNRQCFFAQYLREVHGMDAYVTTLSFWDIKHPRQSFEVPDVVQKALSSALDDTPYDRSGELHTRFHAVADYLEQGA